MDLSGPMNAHESRKTHELAVTRNYISQPRISEHFAKIFCGIFVF